MNKKHPPKKPVFQYALAVFGAFLACFVVVLWVFSRTGVVANIPELSTLAWLFPVVALLILLLSITLFISLRSAKNAQQVAFDVLTQELSEVANKSEIVINSINDGVIALGNDGIIVLINPAAQAILGWSEQDAMHLDYKLVFKLVDKTDQTPTGEKHPVEQSIKTHQQVHTSDFRLVTSSDKRMAVAIDVSPVGEEGRSGTIIVFRDITAELEENKARTEFISTASHEMRTPIAAIEGYLGLALNPQTAVIDDKAKEYLSKAHAAAQHLGRLFQDLLDISKTEDGRLNLNLQIVDLTHIVKDITANFQQSAQAKGLTLTFVPDTARQSGTIVPVYYVEIDPDRTQEIIGNLIENAIKYTKTGEVVVDVGGNDEHAYVSVKDSGIGIPAEDIPHLFQKFYRVDNSDTREIEGTGLGLFLSRQLVETMGGRMSVESVYGKGSTFTVELNRLSQQEIDRKMSEVARTNLGTTPLPAASLTDTPENR